MSLSMSTASSASYQKKQSSTPKVIRGNSLSESPLTEEEDIFFSALHEPYDNDKLNRFFDVITYKTEPTKFVYILENFLLFPMLKGDNKLVSKMSSLDDWQGKLVSLLKAFKTRDGYGFRLVLNIITKVHVYQFVHLRHGLEKPLMKTIETLDDILGWNEDVVRIARSLFTALINSFSHQNLLKVYRHDVDHNAWTNLMEFFYVVEQFIFYRPVRPNYIARSGLTLCFHDAEKISMDGKSFDGVSIHASNLADISSGTFQNVDAPMVQSIVDLLRYHLRVESLETTDSVNLASSKERIKKMTSRGKLALDLFSHLLDFWAASGEENGSLDEIEVTMRCVLAAVAQRVNHQSHKKVKRALQAYSARYSPSGRSLMFFGDCAADIASRKKRGSGPRTSDSTSRSRMFSFPSRSWSEEDAGDSTPSKEASNITLTRATSQSLPEDGRDNAEHVKVKLAPLPEHHVSLDRASTVWSESGDGEDLSPLVRAESEDTTKRLHRLPSDIFTAWVRNTDEELEQVVVVETVIPNLDSECPLDLTLDGDRHMMLMTVTVGDARPIGAVTFLASPEDESTDHTASKLPYVERQSRLGLVQKWVVLPSNADFSEAPRVYVSPHCLTVVFTNLASTTENTKEPQEKEEVVMSESEDVINTTGDNDNCEEEVVEKHPAPPPTRRKPPPPPRRSFRGKKSIMFSKTATSDNGLMAQMSAVREKFEEETKGKPILSDDSDLEDSEEEEVVDKKALTVEEDDDKEEEGPTRLDDDFLISYLLPTLFPGVNVKAHMEKFTQCGFVTVGNLRECETWSEIRHSHHVPAKIVARVRSAIS